MDPYYGLVLFFGINELVVIVLLESGLWQQVKQPWMTSHHNLEKNCAITKKLCFWLAVSGVSTCSPGGEQVGVGPTYTVDDWMKPKQCW